MSEKKKNPKTEEEVTDEKDPKEVSANARERTKGVFRHGNYLEDRSVDYG